MRKIFTKLNSALICLAISSTMVSQTQFQWAKGWGAGFGDGVASVATDPSGNVYSLGVFTGTVDLDPGAGTFTIASLGANDISITKLDPNGNLLWAKRLGGGGNDGPGDLTVDASGNVYSTGFFIGTADFNPGTGVSNLTGTNNEIFISKLDANGNFVWAKSIGGNGSDQGMAIHVDNTGNVYTTGFFNLTADFDPGTTTYTLTSSGGNCIFVSKLDMNGNFVWAKNMGGSSGSFQTYGSDITTDASGNVFTTGSFVNTIDFDPGVGTYTLSCNGGFDQDVFISKLDASGNFSWAVAFGGTTYDNGFGITCDASGDVYTTGTFAFVTDFDASASTYTLDGGSGHDAFVTKYSAAGTFLWAKQLGGTSYEAGKDIVINGTNIYTTGTFENSADFDPGAGIANLSTASGSYASIYVSVLDASGNYSNAISLNSQYSYDQPPTLAIDGTYIVVGGAFEATSDFDPGVGTYTLAAVSANYSDAFVAKIGGVVAGLTNNTISENGVNLFPNPSHDVLNILLTGIDISRPTSLVLMNNLGQTVKKITLNNAQTTLDLEGLNSGLYLYNIEHDNHVTRSGKVIVE